MQQYFSSKLVRQITGHSTSREFDIAFRQISVERLITAYDDMKEHAWIFPRQAIAHGRNDRHHDRIGRSNADLALGWIGEEIDVLHALPQIVEDRDAALRERQAVGRRHHATATAVDEFDPE